MRNDTELALLFIIAGLFTGTAWTVWRHRIVEDLHRIRELLEQRQQWEHDILDALRGDNDVADDPDVQQ